MKLVEEKLGSEGEFAIEIVQGVLKVSLNHLHASGKAGVLLEQDAGYFMDKLAAAIPGTLDDALLAIVKDALKKLA